jgi:hypothetical protein
MFDISDPPGPDINQPRNILPWPTLPGPDPRPYGLPLLRPAEHHEFYIAQIGDPPAAYQCAGCGRAWPGKAATTCRCDDPEAPDYEAWQTWTPARPCTWGMLLMAAWRAWRARRRGWQGWVQLGATEDEEGQP